MFQFENWDMKSRKSCQFDVKLGKTRTVGSSNSETESYSLWLGDSQTSLHNCLEEGVYLAIETKTMPEVVTDKYGEEVKSFSIYSLFLMILLVYNFDEEIDKFENIHRQRYFAPETHGQMPVTYVSKFSYYSTALLFLANFSIFMFYF